MRICFGWLAFREKIFDKTKSSICESRKNQNRSALEDGPMAVQILHTQSHAAKDCREEGKKVPYFLLGIFETRRSTVPGVVAKRRKNPKKKLPQKDVTSCHGQEFSFSTYGIGTENPPHNGKTFFGLSFRPSFFINQPTQPIGWIFVDQIIGWSIFFLFVLVDFHHYFSSKPFNFILFFHP